MKDLRSLSQSRKCAYGLVQIENRSRKLSRRLDVIGVGKIQRFHFFRFRLRLSRLRSSEN